MLYGVIKNYDIKTKTADIVTVESNPILLSDIPVWSIFTGSQIFNIPLQEGTSGIILFGDIDSTDFLYNGNIGISFVNKAQDKYSNALFIPGFNSFMAEYDCPKDGIYIRRGDCSITIKSDELNYASKSSYLDIKEKEIVLDVNGNSKLNILDGGKFEIKNNTGELITEVHKMLDAITSYLKTPGIWEYVNTAGTVTPCTVNIANVALLEAELEPILAKIESFKN